MYTPPMIKVPLAPDSEINSAALSRANNLSGSAGTAHFKGADMSYNPQHMDPPDNPKAKWCDVCGEQIFIDDTSEVYECLNGGYVHRETCHDEYTWALEKREEQLMKKIEKIVSMDFS